MSRGRTTPSDNLAAVSKRWVGRCVVAAPGPSLTAEVAETCRGEHLIAVNDAFRLFPAGVLYACDEAWWLVNDRIIPRSWERWSSHGLGNLKTHIADKFGLRLVAGSHEIAFSLDPQRISYGNNSGFQAINLAILFGANPIILVGFDMREVEGRSHFFGAHQVPLREENRFPLWVAAFEDAAKRLPAEIRILNATPNSALRCFPAVDLIDALRAP